MSGVLVIGEDASFDNPISNGTFCFDISLESDIFKEGLEYFALSLQSNDDCICLGRDVALAQVQANGGNASSVARFDIPCTYMHM